MLKVLKSQRVLLSLAAISFVDKVGRRVLCGANDFTEIFATESRSRLSELMRKAAIDNPLSRSAAALFNADAKGSQRPRSAPPRSTSTAVTMAMATATATVMPVPSSSALGASVASLEKS